MMGQSTLERTSPCDISHFGLSYSLKRKKRMAQRTIMSPPMAKRKYRQPMFELRGQSAAEAQEKSVSRGQATRLPTSCPTAHHTESTVSRYWCVAGVNSVRF